MNGNDIYIQVGAIVVSVLIVILIAYLVVVTVKKAFKETKYDGDNE